jgi:acetyltransferase-like isoleucine patch superfamily enzyme/dTDP-4-dehydrorhamnose 3,5-epimerase-like enzyme
MIPDQPPYFQHPLALVEATQIGTGTRVWAFAHILPGARIGRDCNICDHVFIENEVVIGDRVTVKSGVQLWDGIVLEADTFVGPNATFTNDRFPRSRVWQAEIPRTIVRTGASIGANATIMPGLTIGQNAMVGAGAVVMQDVPPNAIVIGNPAFIKGYVDARPDAAPPPSIPGGPGQSATRTSRVRGVVVHQLPRKEDLRGSLCVAEMGKGLSFVPRRYFTVFDVPSREVRGAHAHRKLHQALTCVHGDCAVMVDDGQNREEIVLDSPQIMVTIEPMVWGVQFRFSRDAVLVVLASDEYDAADYIRDYDEYLTLVNASPGHYSESV